MPVSQVVSQGPEEEDLSAVGAFHQQDQAIGQQVGIIESTGQ
ncbi:hypothetical protein [Gluconobacter frateurii]|nr:hypothetical protein [Gluconobacter frateurii]